VTQPPGKRVLPVARQKVNLPYKKAAQGGVAGKKGRRTPVDPRRGVYHNEAVPDLEPVLGPHGIDAAAFTAWLGPLLGSYRGSAEAMRAIPAKAEQEGDLAAMGRALLKARSFVSPVDGHSLAHIYVAATQRGIDAVALVDRLREDLQTLAVLTFTAQQSVATAPSAKRGPKGTPHRDMLLKQVIEHLTPGLGATLAGRLAHEALTRCGVQVPAEERGQRRAANRPERKGR